MLCFVFFILRFVFWMSLGKEKGKGELTRKKENGEHNGKNWESERVQVAEAHSTGLLAV